MELKQEKAINEHIRDNLKQVEARKDERLRELATELGSVNAKNKGLEGELQRVKDLVEQQKEGISHLNHELNRKDEKIYNLTQELQRVRGELDGMESTVKNANSLLMMCRHDKEQLGTKLEEKELAMGYAQPEAIAILTVKNKELEAQVTSQESEVISHQPSVPSEESTVSSQASEVSNQEQEVSRGELIEYIRQRFPKAKIHPQNITDAINGKSKKMPEYESTYGFKYIGKKVGQHRFKILNQG